MRAAATRVLVFAGVLVAFALLVWAGCSAYTVSAPPLDPAGDSADGSPAAADPRDEKAAVVVPAKPKRTQRIEVAAEPETPAGKGRLEGVVRPELDFKADQRCRLTVLHPTGETIATKNADEKGRYAFDTLPQHVPLVLRVSAPGWLTGYCCDIVLPEDSAVIKDVVLLPAQVVDVRVVLMPQRKPLDRVRVELRQGSDVAVEAVTDADGRAQLVPALPGAFQLRVLHDNYVLPPDVAIELWPGGRRITQEIEVLAGGIVDVAVMTPSGEPAVDAEVRLDAGLPLWPKARTGKDGVATFRGVRPGTAVTAAARAAGNLFGVATGTVSENVSNRIPVLLGEPGVLTGVVLDEFMHGVPKARVEISGLPFLDETLVKRTDDEGRFETEPLPAGIAIVHIQKPGYVDWPPPSPPDPPAPPIEVGPRHGGRFVAKLKPAPRGLVIVTVVDAAKKPVRDAIVTLLPSGLTAETASDGTCRITNVPLVDGTVRAAKDTRRSRRDPPTALRFNAYRSAQLTIQVQDPLTAAAAAAAGPAGELTEAVGQVLETHGIPIPRPVVDATVHDAEGKPIASAHAAGGGDGRFRVGVAAPPGGDQVTIVVGSGTPGMIAPFSVVLDPDARRVADLGGVRLRTRPYARIIVPPFAPPGETLTNDGRSCVFFVSCTHVDQFLGAWTGPNRAVPCVSYDGTWMHVPPPADWNFVDPDGYVNGTGEVYLAFATPRGLVAAHGSWRLIPDVAAEIRPDFVARPGSVRYESRIRDRTGGLTFRQIDCGVGFDPRKMDSWGNRHPVVDPFAGLAAPRTFVVPDAGPYAHVDDVAPGRWSVKGAGTDEPEGFVTVPKERSVSFPNPAKK